MRFRLTTQRIARLAPQAKPRRCIGLATDRACVVRLADHLHRLRDGNSASDAERRNCPGNAADLAPLANASSATEVGIED